MWRCTCGESDCLYCGVTYGPPQEDEPVIVEVLDPLYLTEDDVVDRRAKEDRCVERS